MKKRLNRVPCIGVGVALLVVWNAMSLAASPPELIGFQGVLRDSNGSPRDGDFDMRFRFFDAPMGGNEILTDEHLLGGSGDVTVTQGLFHAALGSGDVQDGSGPGTFSSLGDVFRRLEEVYLEVEVDGEILSPRTRVVSAAYSIGDAPAGPTCSDNANRFVDCGNGTVTDTVSGLIWLSDASCDSLPGLGVDFGDYQAASEAVARLQDGDCGLTDRSSPGEWRLPTSEEWQAVLDQAIVNCNSGPYFPDTLGTGCCTTAPCPFTGIRLFYWSSTSFDTGPASARMANLDGGYMTGNAKIAVLNIWPVRGGP